MVTTVCLDIQVGIPLGNSFVESSSRSCRDAQLVHAAHPTTVLCGSSMDCACAGDPLGPAAWTVHAQVTCHALPHRKPAHQAHQSDARACTAPVKTLRCADCSSGADIHDWGGLPRVGQRQ
eukprot:366278-Chlamydomonas_euryale.AAC.60